MCKVSSCSRFLFPLYQLQHCNMRNTIRQYNETTPNCPSFLRFAGLRLMDESALLDLQHRLEAAIGKYSEELINQLARRDELEFEKEVRNTFITALMDVQNRQREQRDSSKRRRRDKALSLQGGGTPSVNTGSTGRTEKTGGMPAKVRGNQ